MSEEIPTAPPRLSTSEKVAIRNSWLKIGVFGSLTAVAVVKIWQADLSQALTGFDFSDLLSLFLAMFSIGLAVLFYLKATDTSNVFYDNTYRFTKDVSEILGRVEAGFGERLKHLDEGYLGLKSAVERMPYDSSEAERQIKEEEEQVQKVEGERAKLIGDLAERARLQEEEKRELFERLRSTDEELTNARRELACMKGRMAEAEREAAEPARHLPLHIRHHLQRVLQPVRPLVLEAPVRIVNKELREAVSDFPDEFRMSLRKLNILDAKMDLTGYGLDVLRDIVRS